MITIMAARHELEKISSAFDMMVLPDSMFPPCKNTWARAILPR
jgi:hypothetical protein